MPTRTLIIGGLAFLVASGACADGLRVWVVDGLARVRPTDPPGTLHVARLKAARGEYEPFQVVINGGSAGLKGVNVTASALRRPHGRSIPASCLTLYREHYIEVTKPTPRSTEGTGWYPDALIPFTIPSDARLPGVPRFVGAPFDVEPGKNQPEWVDVYVPPNTAAGEYSGTVTVTAVGVAPARVPVRLTVWPFTLPATPTLRSNFGGFGERMGQAFGHPYGSPEFRALERRFAAAMAAHRLCPPIPEYLYPPIQPDGSVDTQRNHSALKEWIETFHVTGFPLNLIGDEPLGKDRERATRYLQSMYAYLKANGWEKMAYIYVLDEPNDKAAYDEVRARAKFIHEAQPGIKVLCTEQPTPQEAAWGTLVGAVDIWVPLWPLLEEKAGAERLAAGEELWSYTALCQGKEPTPFWELDFPLLNYRIPGVMSYRYGMTGLLYWTTVYWEKAGDVWTNPLTYEQFNMEGSLLYPGTAVGYDGPVASMRLKQIREGEEDYEYLRLAEKAAGKARAMELARKVARAWTDWDTDPAHLYALREEMAKEIIGGTKQR